MSYIAIIAVVCVVVAVGLCVALIVAAKRGAL